MAEVLVLGAGSWGTALAMQIARNGHAAWLWDDNAALMERMARERSNESCLPGIPLPEGAAPLDDWGRVQGGVAVLAVPCAAVPVICRQLADLSPAQVCVACKGFAVEAEGGGGQCFNHQVVGSVLPSATVSVMSGPSFALDVAQGKPTAVTVSAASLDDAKDIAGLFHSAHFRCYVHDDMLGAQVGGAVKNVMAIAAGLSDGLGFGASARAALTSRSLHEIICLGVALGARAETFSGLSGAGDLMLTCGDDKSRNRRMGLALAQGMSVEQAQAEIAQVVEGVQASFKVDALARKLNVEMPIAMQVARILRGECAAQEAVEELLSRNRQAGRAAVEFRWRWD